MPQKDQPRQALFKAVLPEEMDWQPFPAFPPAARLAILVGEPAKPDPLCHQGQGSVRREVDAS